MTEKKYCQKCGCAAIEPLGENPPEIRCYNCDGTLFSTDKDYWMTNKQPVVKRETKPKLDLGAPSDAPSPERVAFRYFMLIVFAGLGLFFIFKFLNYMYFDFFGGDNADPRNLFKGDTKASGDGNFPIYVFFIPIFWWLFYLARRP